MGPTRSVPPPRAPHHPSASCDAPPHKGAWYAREPGGGGRTPPVCAPRVGLGPTPYGLASDRGTRGDGRLGRAGRGAATSRGWVVRSAAQSRNEDRKPCGTGRAAAPRFRGAAAVRGHFMVSVVSVHQWHHHRDDINVLVNLKDTVLVPIPKTVETEGVAQPGTWQSRTLVVGLLGSVVLFEGIIRSRVQMATYRYATVRSGPSSSSDARGVNKLDFGPVGALEGQPVARPSRRLLKWKIRSRQEFPIRGSALMIAVSGVSMRLRLEGPVRGRHDDVFGGASLWAHRPERLGQVHLHETADGRPRPTAWDGRPSPQTRRAASGSLRLRRVSRDRHCRHGQ